LNTIDHSISPTSPRARETAGFKFPPDTGPVA